MKYYLQVDELTLFRINFLLFTARSKLRNFHTGNRNQPSLFSTTHSLDPSSIAAHTDWALG